jgi:predicted RNase H-like HicB family nuclease
MTNDNYYLITIFGENKMIKHKEFYVLIEKDEDGYYIGEVPQFKVCYSPGETIYELMENMKEVIEMCIEEFYI